MYWWPYLMFMAKKICEMFKHSCEMFEHSCTPPPFLRKNEGKRKGKMLWGGKGVTEKWVWFDKTLQGQITTIGNFLIIKFLFRGSWIPRRNAWLYRPWTHSCAPVRRWARGKDRDWMLYRSWQRRLLRRVWRLSTPGFWTSSTRMKWSSVSLWVYLAFYFFRRDAVIWKKSCNKKFD